MSESYLKAESERLERLLTAAQVKARFGNISDMSLWRWSRNPALGFPVPVIINGRKFYREDEIQAWKKSRPRKQPEAA
jgi:predicted DNA-binding transcriptional regulator AlpA